MLPITATIPAIEHVLETVDGYLDALEGILAHTPRTYSGPVFLLTHRAIREGQAIIEDMTRARIALATAGNFTRSVPVPGEWKRPVDLLAMTLVRLRSARVVIDRHQAGGPAENVAGLSALAQWVIVASDDLDAPLRPMVELLARPGLKDECRYPGMTAGT